MLTWQERLEELAADQRIRVIYDDIDELNGFYSYAHGRGLICLDNGMGNDFRLCVLAEELGHHFTASRDSILSVISEIDLAREEERAIRWAVDALLPIHRIVEEVVRSSPANLLELSDTLGVIPGVLERAISLHQLRHGELYRSQKYTLHFPTLTVALTD